MNTQWIRTIDDVVIAGDEVGHSSSRFHTFPSLARCHDGSLIATTLVGDSKSGPDGRIKVLRSTDQGQTWTPLASPTEWDQRQHPRCGYLMCHITELSPGRLLAAYLRADRFVPDEPLFHPTTSGMQRTTLRLCESRDGGANWSPPWDLDYLLPDLIVPGRMFHMPDGALAMPFEVWHEWDKGFREGPSTRMIFSRDGGRTWPQAGIIARDARRRLIYGDPRTALLPDGRLIALLWAHDFVAEQDLPIHFSESHDGGLTWSAPRSTGIAGQIANPVWLGDGAVAAFYQKRFEPGTPGMHAVLSLDAGLTWLSETDTLIWAAPSQNAGANPFSGYEMYSFGYSSALRCPDNSILLTFWASNGPATCVRMLRLRAN